MDNQTPVIPNGHFTLENTNKGTHRTIRISTVRRGELEGKRIISLLTGPDNNSNYSGFGFVEHDGKIIVWRKKRENKMFLWIAQCITAFFTGNAELYENLGLKIHIEKRCMRCNRRLTTPESIELGIGPECRDKGFF